jgi:hypothetical protein
MEPRTERRLTTLDVIVLIGATTLGLARLPEVWPEAWEVFRMVDVSHLVVDGFPGRNFAAKPSTGRMDSLGLMSRNLIRPLSGVRPPRPGFRKPDGSQSTYQEWLENYRLSRTSRSAGYAAAGEAYGLAFPFLLVWTISLLVLRLRQPRPEWRGLWRQPGWCGCFAAVAAWAVGLAVEALLEWPAPTVVIPLAVVLAWLVLGLTRKWSAEPSWIDRAGRCLALAWIAMIPLYLVGFVLTLFQ